MQNGKNMNEKYVTFAREPFFEIAKKLINEGDNVLDIGAGNGAFAEFCEYDTMYLFEGNSTSAEKLSSKYQNVENGCLPFLPYKNEFFNVIHMSHVIEHLQPQDVYDTLKEFDRCCKFGGAIVISAPLMWDGFYDDLSHIKPYNPSIFIRYLCSNEGQNYTREAISSNYIVESLQYRYLEKQMLYGFRKSNKILNKAFFKIYEFLRSRGLKQYRKTGYTIVLRKSLKN